MLDVSGSTSARSEQREQQIVENTGLVRRVHQKGWSSKSLIEIVSAEASRCFRGIAGEQRLGDHA